MAHMETTHTPTGGFLGGLLDSFFNGLVAIGEANSRTQEVEKLNALSDAQLARMGLRREDIVRHVFRDSFFL